MAYALLLTLAVVTLGVVVDPVLGAGRTGAVRYRHPPGALARAEETR